MTQIINLEKTARSSSKVTNAKNKVYKFIARMAAIQAGGMLMTGDALNPDKLIEFLKDWKKVSKDANLDHINAIEAPAVESFNEFKDVFLDAQVDLKLKSFKNAIPYLTDGERETLLSSINDTYRNSLTNEVDRMVKRIEVAAPVKVKAKAKAKA